MYSRISTVAGTSVLLVLFSLKSMLLWQKNVTFGTLCFEMAAVLDSALGSIITSTDAFGSINGDEYVRCSRCGYGGCDVRVVGCGCTLHAVRSCFVDFPTDSSVVAATSERGMTVTGSLLDNFDLRATVSAPRSSLGSLL